MGHQFETKFPRSHIVYLLTFLLIQFAAVIDKRSITSDNDVHPELCL